MIDESEAATRAQTVIARTYQASLEEVWSLWTTKEGFESWWGPEGFHTQVHTLEARPGGLLRYDMTAVRQEEIEVLERMGRAVSHPAQARFTELVPHRCLTLTNVIDFIPDVAPYESTIEVDLIPADESVRMVVTLSKMHDEQLTKLSIAGFTSQLKKLRDRFREQPTPDGMESEPGSLSPSPDRREHR